MALSVTEASNRLGITTVRVRQLIAAGDLPATRMGRAWILDEAAVERYSPRRHGRPISEASAWAFLHHLSGSPSNHEDPSREVRAQHVRWEEHLRGLPDETLVPEFLALVRNRATRLTLTADHADLIELRADERLVLSGVSHTEARLLINEEIEGYIARPQLSVLRRDFLLIPPLLGTRTNVVLHVADELPDPLPTAAIAADLAEHRGVREVDAATRMVKALLNA